VGLIPRVLIILCLMAGLLAPKGAAVLASAVPGVVQMVICTGHGLDVITLDAEGTPRRVAHDLPCGAVHALADLGQTAPEGFARTRRVIAMTIPVAAAPQRDRAYLRPGPRAPPVA
tara:strand:- start:401 stop:748 length:348 start_codon:yes stop_codon:yes gene_type:complete